MTDNETDPNRHYKQHVSVCLLLLLACTALTMVLLTITIVKMGKLERMLGVARRFTGGGGGGGGGGSPAATPSGVHFFYVS